MSSTSSLSIDLSPVRLSYVAALRGVVPRAPESIFTYAQVGNLEAETLICLAASNPSGQFYGLMPTDKKATRAIDLAAARQVSNIAFSASASFLPEKLDYLCCEAASQVPTDKERESLFALAEKHLAAGGTLAYRYRAYNDTREILRFLIAEYIYNLSVEQAQEFLLDLKTLGVLYFAQNPTELDALEKAIESNQSSSFFDSYTSGGPAISGALETMKGLSSREFSFAGDADIKSNYLELAAPPSTHDLLIKCREHILYEPIKDFALQRLVRNDVWVRLPVAQSEDKSALFGHFTFGITQQRERIPTTLTTQGAAIALTSPLFTKLIDLMATLPLGVGDFLQHPTGKDFDPDEVMAAVQVLVAGGIAQPMRGRYEGKTSRYNTRPVWASSFNEHFIENAITASTVRLASPIVGSAVTLSVRDALVLQALVRAGLADCAGSFQLELTRILRDNPALAAQIMDTADPSEEVVRNIVTSVVSNGMVRWFAYGLLAA